jgi:hypothetical protein
MATGVSLKLGAIVRRGATDAIKGLGQNGGHNKSDLQKI